MPRGDGTGPMGFGPMTGRAAGWCAGFPGPGFMNRAAGPGFGFGRGRGWRWMYYATGVPGWARAGFSPYSQVPWVTTAGEEEDLLQQQAGFLERQLEAVRARLNKLRQGKGGLDQDDGGEK